MKERKRKIDQGVFDLVMSQKGRRNRSKLKELLGISKTSISAIWRCGSWEAWVAELEADTLKRKLRKQSDEQEIRTNTRSNAIGLFPNNSVIEKQENKPEYTVSDLAEILTQQLEDLKKLTQELVNWEVKKQDQKVAYWAKQREKRSYFSRFGANDE